MATAKGPKDFFEGGTWNIYCSVCGKKIKFSEARRHWQGMWRCTECWEPRPMQDFATGLRAEEMAIPFPQKESDITVVAPAFPASGVAAQNTFTVPITAWIYSQGAQISSILVNGAPVGVPSSVVVPAGETITINYTKTLDALPPMWNWTD